MPIIVKKLGMERQEKKKLSWEQTIVGKKEKDKDILQKIEKFP